MRLEPVSPLLWIAWPLGIVVWTVLFARWSRKGSNDPLAAFGGPIRYAALLIAGSLIGMAVYESFRRGFLLLSALLLFVPLAIAFVVIIWSRKSQNEKGQTLPSQETGRRAKPQ